MFEMYIFTFYNLFVVEDLGFVKFFVLIDFEKILSNSYSAYECCVTIHFSSQNKKKKI